MFECLRCWDGKHKAWERNMEEKNEGNNAVKEKMERTRGECLMKL
jgi:hypothetical protein